jgi:hypothetical protein
LQNLLDRFMAKVSPEPNSGCWLWTGSIISTGYGNLNSGGGQTMLAHRLSYQVFVGSIPAGKELDHLCRVRCCVNPAHLEPVTRAVNVRRGQCAEVTRARNAAQTHCKHGHEYAPANTYWRQLGEYRVRGCRTCRNDASVRYRAAA